MDKYIGIDVHAASCTIAVVDAHGKRAGLHVVATNGQEIVECLRAIPGQKHVCFEEGTQSGWLYEVLEPHAVEVVVAGVAGSRGPKDDKRDAFGLAEDFRLGAIKTRVFKSKVSPGPKDLSHLEKYSLFPRIHDQYELWICNSSPPYRLSLPKWIWATDD